MLFPAQHAQDTPARAGNVFEKVKDRQRNVAGKKAQEHERKIEACQPRFGNEQQDGCQNFYCRQCPDDQESQFLGHGLPVHLNFKGAESKQLAGCCVYP